MNRPLILAATLLAATQLGACDRLGAAVEAFNAPPKAAAPVDATPLPPADPIPPVPTGPLTPTGKGLPVKALPEEGLQYAAGVVEMTPLTLQGDMGAKLFGTAGGDPAMNGLYTYIAFYRDPANGWWVYQVGDFLSYTVLHEQAGQVDLEVEESQMDSATGQIGSRKRRIIIAFPVGPVGDQPVNVRFMPAA
ncbi:hypothetical protein GVN24_34410 [Rhizobium sp. CRIBSB]|nr:hypothetical protein [Rhizobium sp. CRIBSB]